MSETDGQKRCEERKNFAQISLCWRAALTCTHVILLCKERSLSFLSLIVHPLMAHFFALCKTTINKHIPLTTQTTTHKNITKLIPMQFRFGNSSTEITENNTENISVGKAEGFQIRFGKQLLSVISETDEIPETIR